MELCPRTGKLRQTYNDACNAREYMRPGDPRQDLLEVYPCGAGEEDGAEHWHVGHRDLGGRTRPELGHRSGKPVRPLTQRLELPAHLRALLEQKPTADEPASMSPALMPGEEGAA